jgi:hypothetical protein
MYGSLSCKISAEITTLFAPLGYLTCLDESSHSGDEVRVVLRRVSH